MDTLNNPPKKKKLVFILLAIAAVAILAVAWTPAIRYFRFVTQSHYKEEVVAKYFDYQATSCNGIGEKAFMHGAGNSCEKRAWDAGLRCVYDEDCAKKCLYAGSGAKSGTCEEYFGTEDGKTTCHRPLKQYFPAKGDIICANSIS